MVESTVSSEHTESQAASPADTPARAPSVPRGAVIATVLILLLPVPMMLSMMLMMGLFGPPIHGGMAAFGPGPFLVVGVIPLSLVIGVFYGIYRLYAADES